MRSIVFEGDTWERYEALRDRDKQLHRNLCRILKEMQRDDPARGLGKTRTAETRSQRIVVAAAIAERPRGLSIRLGRDLCLRNRRPLRRPLIGGGSGGGDAGASFAIDALATVPTTRHRRVGKRSAVHQRWRGIRWTALSLVHSTVGAMIKALRLNSV